MGPSMSVCLSVAFSQQTKQPTWPRVIVGAQYCNDVTDVSVVTHCCNNVYWSHCWPTALQLWPRKPLLNFIASLQLSFPWFPHWCHCRWCGMNNTFGISVYSKDIAFPILFTLCSIFISFIYLVFIYCFSKWAFNPLLQHLKLLNANIIRPVNIIIVIFQVLMAVKMVPLIFWVLTPCGVVGKYQHFG
jgi:hypothetical protein